jgi:hypothetical protein
LFAQDSPVLKNFPNVGLLPMDSIGSVVLS